MKEQLMVTDPLGLVTLMARKLHLLDHVMMEVSTFSARLEKPWLIYFFFTFCQFLTSPEKDETPRVTRGLRVRGYG